MDYPFVSSRDVSSRELDFRNWLADVRVECARRGVREATIAACFDGLEPYRARAGAAAGAGAGAGDRRMPLARARRGSNPLRRRGRLPRTKFAST